MGELNRRLGDLPNTQIYERVLILEKSHLELHQALTTLLDRQASFENATNELSKSMLANSAAVTKLAEELSKARPLIKVYDDITATGRVFSWLSANAKVIAIIAVVVYIILAQLPSKDIIGNILPTPKVATTHP